MVEHALLALTGQIYDAASGDTSWEELGRGLLALTGARTGVLLHRGPDGMEGPPLFSTNLPPEAVRDYGRHYRHVDIWTQRAAEASARAPAAPRIWASGTLVRDDEFVRSEFYGDFGRHHGLRYVVGTVVPLGAAGWMSIGLHRPAGATAFDEEERRRLGALLPHLSRAIQLRHRLRAAPGEAGPPALDALSVGVLVVNAELAVLTANLAAEQGLAGSAALRVMGAPSHLQALGRGQQDALLRLVQATAAGRGAGGALLLSAGDGATDLILLVSPLPRRLSGAPGGGTGRVPGQAMILLRPAQQVPQPQEGVLRALYGLTPAEAAVAISLCRGESKAIVAAQRGLRETTIRTQTRAVLEKTGAANLRELALRLGQILGA